MMTVATFAGQQRSLGLRIHEHDGEFWEEVRPFYCKPAFPYRAFDRGAVRPDRWRSLLGYSHPVHRAEEGNRTLATMELDRGTLDGYGLEKLPQKKRNQVRRAMERCEIRLIADLESWLERMREINLGQAVRLGAEGAVSPERYTRDAEDWRAQIRREFALPGREWWGAFVDGRLAAYLRTYQVEDVRIIQQTKADPECYCHKPMDALYHAVLAHAAADPGCRRIVNGSPLHGSLNHFKEQFLFRTVERPWYSSTAWLVELVKWWRNR